MQVLPQNRVLARRIDFAAEGTADSVRTVPRATGEVSCVGNEGSSMEFLRMHGDYRVGTRELLSRAALLAREWQRNYPLQPSDLPKAHAFIDGSVIELILSERVAYTKRFDYVRSRAAPDITIPRQRSGRHAEGLESFPHYAAPAHHDQPSHLATIHCEGRPPGRRVKPGAPGSNLRPFPRITEARWRLRD